MNKKSNILIVDDESDFVQPLALRFKAKGYSVEMVCKGEDAVRIIRHDPPDLVILDILMPHMDGYTVLKLVREFNKTVPVIMMSAYERESKVKRKVNFYGVYGFFDKTEDFARISEMVESALKLE